MASVCHLNQTMNTKRQILIFIAILIAVLGAGVGWYAWRAKQTPEKIVIQNLDSVDEALKFLEELGEE